MQMFTVCILQNKSCVGATIRKHPHRAAERYPGAVSETPKFVYAPYETPKAWTGLFSGIKEACRRHTSKNRECIRHRSSSIATYNTNH